MHKEKQMFVPDHQAREKGRRAWLSLSFHVLDGKKTHADNGTDTNGKDRFFLSRFLNSRCNGEKARARERGREAESVNA